MADTWITRIVVVLGFVTALITLWRLLKTDKKINEVHLLVNSQLTAVVNRVSQLVLVLKAHDINVPDDPVDTVIHKDELPYATKDGIMEARREAPDAL